MVVSVECFVAGWGTRFVGKGTNRLAGTGVERRETDTSLALGRYGSLALASLAATDVLKSLRRQFPNRSLSASARYAALAVLVRGGKVGRRCVR